VPCLVTDGPAPTFVALLLQPGRPHPAFSSLRRRVIKLLSDSIESLSATRSGVAEGEKLLGKVPILT
jgi:hypothetical protein